MVRLSSRSNGEMPVEPNKLTNFLLKTGIFTSNERQRAANIDYLVRKTGWYSKIEGLLSRLADFYV